MRRTMISSVGRLNMREAIGGRLAGALALLLAGGTLRATAAIEVDLRGYDPACKVKVAKTATATLPTRAACAWTS